MSSVRDANLDRARSALADAVDGGTDVMRLAEDLFGLSDVVKTDPALRRSLTDPGRSAAERQGLARSAFGKHVGPATVSLVERVVSLHWSDPMALYDALEVLGITATLEDARAEGRLEDVEKELFSVSELLVRDRELREALSDLGGGTPHERADLAERIFGPHLSRWAMRLLRRGVGRTSHGRLLSTLRRFCERAASMRGLVFVTVEAASPLSEAQEERLRRLAAERLGHEVSLNATVDPSLIGGFRLRTGTTSIDSTVSTRVSQLKRALTH
jgi:F-type H+-transporting ATPase subunit delta